MKYLLIILILLMTCTYLIPFITSLLNESSKVPPFKLLDKTKEIMSNDNVLINLPFMYLIQNNCSFNNLSKIEIIQIVTSYAGNVEARSALRRAYPKDHLQLLGIYRVFLLAALKTGTSEVTQNAIINENERFNDLIQGNFVEAYKNLTYKHVMGLNWAVKYCNNVNYIIKMDDDIVVNIYYLLNLIKLNYKNKNVDMLGYIFNNMRPIRIKANKWYVTKKEYDGNIYPSFLSGWLYVVSFKTAQILVNLSTQTPFFWIDDVYITGILTNKANVKFENLGEYFTTNPEYFECCIRDKVQCDIVAGPNGGDNNLQILFQKHALKCHNSGCKNYTNGKFLNNSCITQRKLPPLGKGLPQLNVIKL